MASSSAGMPAKAQAQRGKDVAEEEAQQEPMKFFGVPMSNFDPNKNKTTLNLEKKPDEPLGVIDTIVQLSSRFLEGAPAAAKPKLDRLNEPKGARPKQRIKPEGTDKLSEEEADVVAVVPHKDEVILTPMERKQRDAVSRLLEAAKAGDVETCRTMGENGVELEMGNDKGWTAMHVAARYGQIEVIETLLDLQMDDEVKDLGGRTALHVAAEYGQAEVLELLIDIGTDVGSRCGRGLKKWTALMFAAASNNVEIIGTLLHTDVSLQDDKDSDGNTALKIAQTHGAHEALHVLEMADEARRLQTKKQKRISMQARRSLDERRTAKLLLRQQSSFRVSEARSPDRKTGSPSGSFNQRHSQSFQKLHKGFRQVSTAAAALARMSRRASHTNLNPLRRSSSAGVSGVPGVKISYKQPPKKK